MALCEGPIAGVGLIWKDLSIYVPLELGLGIFNGTTPQEVWPYLAAIYPFNALAYQGTAIAWGAGYNLGDSAAIGNHNFEIFGILAGTGANGIDADPALVIQDFLTNAQYGCGFNPASIDSGSLFTNPDSFQAYCRSMGYAFSPALVEPGASVEHPDALAANLLNRRRVERWAAQIHPLRRHGDLCRGKNKPSARSSRFRSRSRCRPECRSRRW